ncbi:MAG: ketoacyl-ACP synthase III [Spirochaetaceae bacterium]|jgi:3-oxoacyl-[acyl-carrier-protein] synthase-3|nr:ketoacyl-ACP synthase III [Spirochaetaceae bacterium]
MAIEIKATGRAIPAKRLTNTELPAGIDTSDDWIRSHTGIGSRHIADDAVACSDLALSAARSALTFALEQDGVQEKTLEEIALTLDMIILGTATADYYGCPSTACIIQNKLGAKNAGAMDISAGCSGFIYGLEIASGLLSINPARKRALVIGSEVLSRFLDWNDRGSCVLFGDGAGAALLEKTDNPKRGILRTILKADGSGSDHLMIKRGGSRNCFKSGEVVDIHPHVEMNGRAVYIFAVRAMTEIIAQLMEAEGVGVDDLRWIVPHQANARIVSAAAKRLSIPDEKFVLNIEEYANTSSASIPIVLDELNRGGKLRRGDLIMTVGFGAGLTYGGNLIVF